MCTIIIKKCINIKLLVHTLSGEVFQLLKRLSVNWKGKGASLSTSASLVREHWISALSTTTDPSFSSTEL